MSGHFMMVPPGAIYPNPRNPRKTFNPEAMAELTENIKQHGIIQPLVVVADAEKPQMWRLVCGERRWRAAVEAGLELVPVVVMEYTLEQELEVMIIENWQRKDVNPIEEAYGLKAILDAGGHTQDSLAQKIGCSQAQIANRLRLLELPESVKENISRGIIGTGHAKELLVAKKIDPAIIEKVAKKAADEGLTVRQVAAEVARELWNSSKPLAPGSYWDAPKFDISVCEKCRSKTMVKEPFGIKESLRCLDPGCWNTKQQDSERHAVEDIEAELQQKYPDAVIVNDMDRSTYVIMHRWNEDLINRCTDKGCEYFQQGRRQGGENIFYICRNPEEYQNCSCLQKEAGIKEREDKKARERKELRQLVAGKIGAVDGHGSEPVLITRAKLIFLTAVILECCEGYNYGLEGVIEYLRDVVGHKLKEFETGDLLGDEWPHLYQLLNGFTTDQLLHIAFEWPAVALGMDRPGVEWFFKGVPISKEEPAPKISGRVEWILNNSCSDINYSTNIPSLTDDELLYCLEREKRSSGRRKLQAEVRRRGIQEPKEEDEPLFDTNTCRICGCTDDNACPGGCWWVEPDLCSSCAEVTGQETVPDPVHALMGRRIKTNDGNGGVIINVIGPKDDGYYTINYKEPHSKKKSFSIIHGITLEDGILMRYGAPTAVLENDEDVSAHEHEEFLDRRYLDEKGREIFISESLSSGTFGAFRQSSSGGLHRVKSPAMPMVDTKEEAQRNLDAWAKEKGLKLVVTIDESGVA